MPAVQMNNTRSWGYTFSDQLNQYSADGKEISYRLAETETPKNYVPVRDANGELWNVRTEAYTAKIVWMDNADGYASRPQLAQLEELITNKELQLGFLKNTSFFKDGIDLTTKDQDAPGYIQITEAGNTWEISMPNLPKYNEDNTEMGPYLVIDPEVRSGADVVKDTVYEDKNKYENVLNHASVTDGKLFTGGTVTETLSATTRYQNTKFWKDAKGQNVDRRPDAKMTIYRYADGAGNNGNNYNYRLASPVPGEGVENIAINTPEITAKTASEVSFTIPAEKLNALPAYNTDGIKYFYLGKEKLSGGQYKHAKDQYVTKYREKLKDGTWTQLKDAVNGYVPDGAEVYNILTGTVDKKVTKVWNAAGRQDVNAKVELSLDQKSAAGQMLKEGFRKAVLDGFSAEIKEKSEEFKGLPAYDEEGNAYDYSQPSESAVYTDANKDGKITDDEKATLDNGFIITKDGYRYQQTFDNRDPNESRIINTLVGNAKIVITKQFPDKFIPGTNSATLEYTILRNGKEIGKVTRTYQTTSPNAEDGFGSTYVDANGMTKPFEIDAFEDLKAPAGTGLLPRYDGQGAQYAYSIVESDSAGYTHKATISLNESQTYEETDTTKRYYKGEHYLETDIVSVNRQGEEGPEISVYKEWIDAEETLYRKNVVVELQYQEAGKHEWKKITGGTITPQSKFIYMDLSAAEFNDAYPDKTSAGNPRFIDTEKDRKDPDQQLVSALYKKWNDGIDGKRPEMSTRDTPAFRIVEKSVGGAPVYMDNEAVPGEADFWKKHPEHERGYSFVVTDQQDYDVSYRNQGYTAEGQTFTFGIINKRVGTEKITLKKVWDDGNNTKGIRPDAVQITVSASQNVWGDNVNVATGQPASGNTALNPKSTKTYELRPGTVGTEVNADGNTWSLTTEYLRKYDDKGAVIAYTVVKEELIYDNDPKGAGDPEKGGQYAGTLTHGSYVIGRHHTDDRDTYTYTNSLSAMVNPVMYKYWKDLGYEKTGQNRPDIRAVLYRSYYDASKPSAGLENGQQKDNVFEKVGGFTNHDWDKSVGGATSQDFWKATYAAVPRYRNGYEITYYVGEEWASANLNDYRELGAFAGEPEVSAGKLVYDETDTQKHPATSITITENGQTVTVPVAKFDNRTGKGGTIVNRPEAPRDILGSKQWPTDDISAKMIENKIPFPDVVMKLYRISYRNKAASEASGWKDHLEPVTEHQEKLPNGELKIYPWGTDVNGAVVPEELIATDGTEKTAAVKLKGGDKEFRFNRVAKYDPDGGTYTYVVKEAPADPDVNVAITYTLVPDDDGGAVTAKNVYNYHQNYTVKFSKNWQAKYDSLDTDPQATLTLVRYLQKKEQDGTRSLVKASRSPVLSGITPGTLGRDAAVANKADPDFPAKLTVNTDGSCRISVQHEDGKKIDGIQTITWSDLAYYAPNGLPFVYKIEETSGLTARDTLASVKVTPYTTDTTAHTAGEEKRTVGGKEMKLITVSVDPVDANAPYDNGTGLSSGKGEAASGLSNTYGEVLGGIKIVKTWAGDDQYEVSKRPAEIQVKVYRSLDNTFDEKTDKIETRSDKNKLANGILTLKDDGKGNYVGYMDELELNSADGQPLYYFAKEIDPEIQTAYESSSKNGVSSAAQALPRDTVDAAGKLDWDIFHAKLTAAKNIASIKNTIKQESASVTKKWEKKYPDGKKQDFTPSELQMIDSLGGMPHSITYRVFYNLHNENGTLGDSWKPLYKRVKNPDGTVADTLVSLIGWKSKDTTNYTYPASIGGLPTYTIENGKALEISYRLAEYQLHYGADGKAAVVTNAAFTSKNDLQGISNYTGDELSGSPVGEERSFSVKRSEDTVKKPNDTVVTNDIPVRDIRVVKFWNDQYDRDQTRPEELSVTMTRTGVNSQTDTEDEAVVLTKGDTAKQDIKDPTTLTSAEAYSKAVNVWTKTVTVPRFANAVTNHQSAYTFAEDKAKIDSRYTQNDTAILENGVWKWAKGTTGTVSSPAEDTVYFRNAVEVPQRISIKPVKTWTFDGKKYDGSAEIPDCYQEHLRRLSGKIAFTLQYRLDGKGDFNDIKERALRAGTDFDEVQEETTQTAQISVAGGYSSENKGALAFANGFTMWQNLPVHENDSSVPNAPVYEYRVVEKIDGKEGKVWNMKELTGLFGVGTGVYEQAAAQDVNAEEVLKDLALNKVTSVTLNNSFTETELSVTKNWEDAEDAYSLRPDKLLYKISYKKEGEIDYKPLPDGFLNHQTSDVNAGKENVEISKPQTGDWTVTIKNLPKFAPDGALYEYQLEETALVYGSGNSAVTKKLEDSPYTAKETVVEAVNDPAAAFKAEFTNQLRTTELTVSKIWDDQGTSWNQEVTEAKIVLKRRAEGNTTYTEVTKNVNGKAEPVTVILSHTANRETHTFKELPAYDQNGKTYEYIAEETALLKGNQELALNEAAGNTAEQGRIGNYRYQIKNETEGGKFKSEITNTVILGSIKAQKIWDDEHNQDDLRPDSLTFTLKRSSENEAEANLPEYKLSEVVNGVKEEVTYGNGQEIGKDADDPENRKDAWTGYAEWKALPLYDTAGKPYTYKVAESGNGLDQYTAVDGNELAATPDAEGKEALVTFTNRREVQTSSITATKIFDDTWTAESPENPTEESGTKLKGHSVAEDQPDSVELTLMAHVDGTDDTADYQVVTDAAGDNIENPVTVGENTGHSAWQYSWKKLPRYAAAQGAKITYYVVETPKAGYREDTTRDLAVTNRYTSTSITVRKLWEGDQKLGIGTAVSKATFQIERKTDGSDFVPVDGLTAELERTDGALKSELTIVGLQAYDKQDKAYTYRAVETSITVNGIELAVRYKDGDKAAGQVGGYDYELTLSGEEKHPDGSKKSDFVSEITNRLKTAALTASKNWDDFDNAYGIRPTSVTFHLVQNDVRLGAEFDRTVNGPDFAEVQWSELPICDAAGKEFLYAIEEDPVAGYYFEAGAEVKLAKEAETRIENTNKLYGIAFTKLDEAGTLLAGSSLQLTNADGGEVKDLYGETVEAWISETTPHTIPAALPDGTYMLVETKAPDGYTIADPVVFQVKNAKIDGSEEQTAEITMTDQTSRIYLRKTDQNGAGLAGAKLTLRTADGQPVTTVRGELIKDWISESDAREIRGIPDGAYILHEEEAPPRYRVADDLRFTVRDGHIAETDDDTITMIDAYAPRSSGSGPSTSSRIKRNRTKTGSHSSGTARGNDRPRWSNSAGVEADDSVETNHPSGSITDFSSWRLPAMGDHSKRYVGGGIVAAVILLWILVFWKRGKKRQF